ncbi:MAG: hypothetical protein ACFHX7_18450 [Pseudomonadota bacterium]
MTCRDAEHEVYGSSPPVVKALENWDGKSSSDIVAIYHRFCQEKHFVPRIIELAQHKTLEKGATWLLKHHLENKHKLNAREIASVYKLAQELENWEARLHILQCVPYMPIGAVEKRGVELFLRDCLVDRNKFVRAWAYNGFYEMSLQYPEYTEETKKLCEMGMRDEAPSVKARIRNIMKNGF